MPLPAILKRRADGSMEVLKAFGYGDFRNRLGGGEPGAGRVTEK